jgi:hypothetical protein
MSGNFLHFGYFDFFRALIISAFLSMSIVFILIFILDLTILHKKGEKGVWTGIKIKIALLFIRPFFSPFIAGFFAIQATNNNFPDVYDVKFVEQSPVSKIQYFKKENVKNPMINLFLANSGTLYIAKDLNSDNYFVSPDPERVLSSAKNENPTNYNVNIFSKEDIKKTIENKVEEVPVAKENEFK